MNDNPARLLSFMLRALPPARADWSAAMRAELALITERPHRWSFVLSCWRLVLPALLSTRTAGLLVLAAMGTLELVDVRDHSGNPQGRFVTAILISMIMLGYVVTLLNITGRTSPLSRRSVAAGSFGALGAAGVWWLLTMTQPSVGTSLGVRALTASVAGVAASAWTTGLLQRAGAALWAAAGTLLLIVLAAVLTMQTWPSRVPHIVDPMMIPGSTAAQKLAENQIEAGDTYGGVLVFGALAAVALGLLVGAARPLLSLWLVPAVGGVLLIAYALSYATWPEGSLVGAGGILLTTTALALSARRGTSRRPA